MTHPAPPHTPWTAGPAGRPERTGRSAAHPGRTTRARPAFSALFALGVLALGTVVGCGADAGPPAVAVADVGFSEQELGALSDARRSRLAVLTAFGVTVARAELDRLGRPFIERDRRSRVLQKLAVEVALDRAGLDETELRRRYRRDPEAELVVRHILFMAEPWRPDSVHAEKRREATAALEHARAGEDFPALAAELSEEPGAAQRGGRLEPGREGSWVDPFWRAASALEVGEISDVVQSRYGYHVIRLEDRRVVPFEEVRDRVIERLVDVEAGADQAEMWADSVAAELSVDRDAVRAWRAGDSPDSTALAAWPGGRYTAAAFRDYLHTLDQETRERLEPAPTPSYASFVRSAARNVMLAEKARGMGIELPAAARAAVDSVWRADAQRWAAALGFERGQEPSTIKRAAVAALGATQQSARLAREEVLALEPVLRSLHPIRVAEPSEEDAPDA